MRFTLTATGIASFDGFEPGSPYEPPPMFSRITVDVNREFDQNPTYFATDPVIRIYSANDPNEVIFTPPPLAFINVKMVPTTADPDDGPWRVDFIFDGQSTVRGPGRYDAYYDFPASFRFGDAVGTPPPGFESKVGYTEYQSFSGRADYYIASVTSTIVPEPGTLGVVGAIAAAVYFTCDRASRVRRRLTASRYPQMQLR